MYTHPQTHAMLSDGELTSLLHSFAVSNDQSCLLFTVAKTVGLLSCVLGDGTRSRLAELSKAVKADSIALFPDCIYCSNTATSTL